MLPFFALYSNACTNLAHTFKNHFFVPVTQELQTQPVYPPTCQTATQTYLPGTVWYPMTTTTPDDNRESQFVHLPVIYRPACPRTSWYLWTVNNSRDPKHSETPTQQDTRGAYNDLLPSPTPDKSHQPGLQPTNWGLCSILHSGLFPLWPQSLLPEDHSTDV